MLCRNLSVAVALGLMSSVSGVSHAQVGGCTALTLVSQVDTPGLETVLDMDDGWMIVASDHEGVVDLYDIRDPENPVLRSSVTVAGVIHEVSIDEMVVAMSVDDDGPSYGDLLIYDWSDPDNPVLASRLESSAQEGVIALDLVGDRLFLTNSQAFFEFDVVDPYDPQWSAVFVVKQGTDIIYRNGTAFVSSTDPDTLGIFILDVHTPGTITQKSFYPLNGITAWDLALGDRFICVTVNFQSVLAIDISDLTNPVFASLVTSPKLVISIGARFNALYVGEYQSGGLHVFDMSDMTSPQWISSHDPPSMPWVVESIRGVVAVADPDNGVYLFQMSDCTRCRPDLAEPTGVLDFYDVQAFLTEFTNHGRAADLDVNAIWDAHDVLLYLESYAEGCS